MSPDTPLYAAVFQQMRGSRRKSHGQSCGQSLSPFGR